LNNLFASTHQRIVINYFDLIKIINYFVEVSRNSALLAQQESGLSEVEQRRSRIGAARCAAEQLAG
jgi:hypothetical protein